MGGSQLRSTPYVPRSVSERSAGSSSSQRSRTSSGGAPSSPMTSARRAGLSLRAGMPTTTWNKRWGADLNRFLERGVQRPYGDQWGDPTVSGWRYLLRKLRHGRNVPGDLSKVPPRFIVPYLAPDSVALEIGAGGGRWTRYLLGAREVIAVDLNGEFFPYIESRYPEAAGRLRFYETSGYEMQGIEDASVDFIFSFGTFVHIDPDGIDAYLAEIRRVLRPGRVATVHYADRTKRFFAGKADDYAGFSAMSAPKMEELARAHGFQVVEHDRKLLNHSNVVVLRKPA